MEKAKVRAPRLFFLYAHPCGDVLVKRGTIRKRGLLLLRKMLAEGAPASRMPMLFEKAWSRLRAYAKGRKARITPSLVGEYFASRHNAAVLRSARHARDLEPEKCFISPAVILRASRGGKSALAGTPFGIQKINTRFLPKLKAGDLVAAHYACACEKVSRREFARLWRESG